MCSHQWNGGRRVQILALSEELFGWQCESVATTHHLHIKPNSQACPAHCPPRDAPRQSINNHTQTLGTLRHIFSEKLIDTPFCRHTLRHTHILSRVQHNGAILGPWRKPSWMNPILESGSQGQISRPLPSAVHPSAPSQCWDSWISFAQCWVTFPHPTHCVSMSPCLTLPHVLWHQTVLGQRYGHYLSVNIIYNLFPNHKEH